jgi:hypothetical protein
VSDGVSDVGLVGTSGLPSPLEGSELDGSTGGSSTCGGGSGAASTLGRGSLTGGGAAAAAAVAPGSAAAEEAFLFDEQFEYQHLLGTGSFSKVCARERQKGVEEVGGAGGSAWVASMPRARRLADVAKSMHARCVASRARGFCSDCLHALALTVCMHSL